MVRYFYVWTPLVIVATVSILSMPWLGLIAVLIVAIGALGALAVAIVWLPRMLGRAISRRWQRRRGAREWTATALSPANSAVRPTRPVSTGATVLLVNSPTERER